jgi:hypothetical protein
MASGGVNQRCAPPVACLASWLGRRCSALTWCTEADWKLPCTRAGNYKVMVDCEDATGRSVRVHTGGLQLLPAPPDVANGHMTGAHGSPWKPHALNCVPSCVSRGAPLQKGAPCTISSICVAGLPCRLAFSVCQPALHGSCTLLASSGKRVARCLRGTVYPAEEVGAATSISIRTSVVRVGPPTSAPSIGWLLMLLCAVPLVRPCSDVPQISTPFSLVVTAALHLLLQQAAYPQCGRISSRKDRPQGH